MLSYQSVYLEQAKANALALLFALYVAELRPGSWEMFVHAGARLDCPCAHVSVHVVNEGCLNKDMCCESPFDKVRALFFNLVNRLLLLRLMACVWQLDIQMTPVI